MTKLQNILFLLLLFGIFSCKHSANNSPDKLYRCIPTDAYAILKINNVQQFNALFIENNSPWIRVMECSNNISLLNQLRFVDSLTNHSQSLKECLSHSPLLLSFHQRGNAVGEFMLYLPLFTSISTDLQNLVDDAEIKGFSIREKNYEGSTLHIISDNKNKETAYAILNDLLLVSSSASLLEEAIRQSTLSINLYNDSNFVAISKTAGDKVSANLFVNFKYSALQTEKYFSDHTRKSYRNSGPPANWACFDMIGNKDNKYMLNGFMSSNEKQFFHLFNDQTPQKTSIIGIMPNNVHSFALYGFDPKSFFKKYQNYLSQIKELDVYKNEVQNFKKQYSLDPEKMFHHNSSGEMAVCFTAGDDNPTFMIIGVDDKVKMIENLRLLVDENKRQTFKSSDIKFDIFEIPDSKILSTLFPNFFMIHDLPYLTFLDNYIIAAASIQELKDFIGLSLSGNKLVFTKKYMSFSTNIPNKTNFLLYSDISQSMPFTSAFIEVDEPMEKNIRCFENTSGTCFHVSSMGKNILYTNFLCQFFDEENEEIIQRWKTKLDTISTMIPLSVINHNSSQTELFFQDLANTIYLIDTDGKILWKKKLNEKMMGNVHQIDYYQNKKLQYLFNTKNFIHLIDRNGNDVKGFPVKLQSPSTNPIAVFDYDKKRDYRMLIALSDKGIYCLDKDAKAINGWSFDKTESEVKSPISYFTLGDRDFLVAHDQKRTYFLNRKGEARVTMSENVVPAKNNFYFSEQKTSSLSEFFVTSDSLGQIQIIYPEGRCETLNIGKYPSNHYFDYQDFDNDGIKDFMLSFDHKILVYQRHSKQMHTIKIDCQLTQRPIFYNNKNNSPQIQVFDTVNQKVNLLDHKGEIWKNSSFPASTSALVYELSDKFFIFVNSFDAYLYNYSIRK